jgi:hypothetical protein
MCRVIHGRPISALSIAATGGAVTLMVAAALFMWASNSLDLQERLVSAATSTCSPQDTVLPSGQVSPSPSGDPLMPAYCVPPPAAQPATRLTGANDWVDDFGVQGMSSLNDGNMGYRVFDTLAGTKITKHLVVGDHWIDDNDVQFGGGAMLSPNRTFVGENGKLVVEGDAAAGKQVYNGNQWVEFVISTSVRPDINPPDPPEQIYAYGRFKGFPTFGCRFQDSGENTCAGFTGSTLPFPATADKPPCFSLDPDRLWELSFFQNCGDNFGGVHFGGFPDPARSVYRSCAPTQDYDFCLDRFRIELTRSSLVIYVNGIRYFEDSGWDALHQLPAALFNGPVYVYFADWSSTAPNPVYRFHWERLAINPHQANGSFAAPSASASYCPSQPQFTCQSGSPAPTSTPTPPTNRTPTPTPTSPVATPGVVGQTTITFDDLTDPSRVLSGQYPAGVIDWGADSWWLSGPYSQDTTNSVSFNGAGPTSATMTFVSSGQLLQLDAINGGTADTIVSLSCPGQLTVQASLAAGQTGTLRTNWSGTCPNVAISSSNGWDTNFDNLVITSTSGNPSVSAKTPTQTPTQTPARTAAPTQTATRTPIPTQTATQTPPPTPTQTPPPTRTQTPAPKQTRTPPPTQASAPSGSRQTITFDDLSNPQRPLTGQYPSGVINWGTGAWYLSGPYSLDTTNSISFNGAGPTSASFQLLTPHTVVSLDIYNGAGQATTVTLACAGQPTRQLTVAGNQKATLTTGWTGTCTTVTVSSTNGWTTNFDNLVIQ